MSDEATAVATVEKPKAALVKQTKGVGDVSLTPDQFIKAAIASGYYKHLKGAADGYLILAYGASLGMDPATAMSSIIMVQGRMTFTANFIAAQIKKSGRYRYKVVTKDDKKCVLEFWEKVEHCPKDSKPYWEWEKAGTETFSVEMAKRAGLVKPGSNWISWPEAMCFARAITAGARTYSPELFLGQGIYTPDEIDSSMKMTVNSEGDVVPDAEYTVAPQQPAVKDRIDDIRKLLKQTDTDERAFLMQLCKVESAEKLSHNDQSKVLQVLTEKFRSQPKGG